MGSSYLIVTSIASHSTYIWQLNERVLLCNQTMLSSNGIVKYDTSTIEFVTRQVYAVASRDGNTDLMKVKVTKTCFIYGYIEERSNLFPFKAIHVTYLIYDAWYFYNIHL